MFFSHVARIIAVLALVLGILQVLMGFSIANEWMGLSVADLGRYTTAATTGEVINRGTYLILGAVALGTLAEVGLANRKNQRQPAGTASNPPPSGSSRSSAAAGSS
jgi:hypothetical protein